jgi:uncharacterized protein YggE
MNFKETFLMSVAFAGLVLGLSPRSETVNHEPSLMNVSGEAVVKVVPDEVILTMGVETYHRELSVAKGRNDERVSEVIKLSNRYGVQSGDIQTDFVSIEPRYQDTYDRTIIEGYFVRKTIVLTLKDLSKFDRFLSDVTEEGITHVHGIQFRTTELRKYRDQARKLALQAAEEKAQDMAAVFNAQIGFPRTILEDHVGWYSWYGYGWWGSQYGFASQNVVQTVGGPSLEVDSSLAPGQISVSARVTVSFELLQNGAR